MKSFIVCNYGDDTRRLVSVEDDCYLNNLVLTEDGDIFESEEGTLEGLNIAGDYILECNCDIFYEVDFKEISRETDFYGTGYDKVVALVDGEEETLKANRWTSGNSQPGLEFM